MNEARLDKWLFCARLCRTRETAQEVIAAGKVRLNGAKVRKPGHVVRPGDTLTLALSGTVRVVTVLLGVARVVERVDRAGREAKGQRRVQHRDHRGRIAPGMTEQQADEYEAVLDPLAGPQQLDQRERLHPGK